MKICVSYLKSKTNLTNTINELNNTICDYIHVDVMDGKFVPNKTYEIKEIIQALKMNNKPLDVHLMCNNVQQYIIEYADLMPEYITFHLEVNENINQLIELIHDYNIKCGISIKPNTKVEELIPYLDKIDLVLIMSVEPGQGGQKFIENTLEKIKELKKLNSKVLISVDGGINSETIKNIDTDMVVSGSFICLSDDYNYQIEQLLLNQKKTY